MSGIDVDPVRKDRVTVVTWPHVRRHLLGNPISVRLTVTAVGGVSVEPFKIGWNYCPCTEALEDPGNSSLKGISRFLELEDNREDQPEWERTVVLLGDVVYSWDCLRAIFANTEPWPRFVGTSNLSPGGGELWGISWLADADAQMRTFLGSALERHPPFHGTYQPGQLRRWLWEANTTFDALMPDAMRHRERPWFVPIDDYTRDIDLPEHVLAIPKLSEAAAADDAANGVTW